MYTIYYHKTHNRKDTKRIYVYTWNLAVPLFWHCHNLIQHTLNPGVTVSDSKLIERHSVFHTFQYAGQLVDLVLGLLNSPFYLGLLNLGLYLGGQLVLYLRDSGSPVVVSWLSIRSMLLSFTWSAYRWSIASPDQQTVRSSPSSRRSSLEAYSWSRTWATVC